MGSARSSPPPARGLRIAFLVLCTVGACLSADLIRLHVRVHTDPNYHSYCAISERVDCETVAQSPHSVFLGMPTAVWGLFGYLLLGSLAVWGLRSRLPERTWPFGALFWLSTFSLLVSAGLFAVSLFVVRSTCIVCAGTYVVNLALLIVAALELRGCRSGPLRSLRSEAAAVRRRPGMIGPLVLAFSALVAVTWIAVPPYWRLALMTGPGGLPVGRTPDGHWWIGARNPALDVVEFSDYQCPFCQRGHSEIRLLVQQHPDRVRLTHRHYPLDPACNPVMRRPMHPQACRYAAMAHCAGEQERFWEANDYLFENGRRESPVTSEELSSALGLDAAALRTCVDGEKTRSALASDLADGQRLKVRGTPTFLINGQTYPGAIPDEVIRNALGASLPGSPGSD